MSGPHARRWCVTCGRTEQDDESWPESQTACPACGNPLRSSLDDPIPEDKPDPEGHWPWPQKTDPGGDMSNSIPWNQRLDAATSTSIEAEEQEVKIALKAMCLAALNDFPTATKIRLDDSDQGDWAVIDAVLDENDNVLSGDYWDDGWDYASHLYDPRAYVWTNYLENPDDWHHKNPGRGTLVISKVLEGLEDL